ncbi:MAG: hypothetical protein ABIN23_07190 [candidate division WOR-3 bacterium]|nr:hypothetical protein [Candidatus Omnitrophota bacterium]
MKMQRIRPIYKKRIKISRRFKAIFWDCPNGETYLEKFILRILKYGNFEEIKWIYDKFPEETYDVALRYPEMKRGVKFWIRLWKEKKLKR